jgi:hypothetical protein
MQRRAGSLRIGCKRLGKRDTASCKHVQANAGWRDAVETYRAQIGSKLLPIYQVRKTTGRSRTVVRQYLRLSQRTAYRPSSVLEWLSANWPGVGSVIGCRVDGASQAERQPEGADHGQHRLSASIDNKSTRSVDFLRTLALGFGRRQKSGDVGAGARVHAKAQLCGEGVEIDAARYAVSSWRANCRTTSSSGAARKKPTFASDF